MAYNSQFLQLTVQPAELSRAIAMIKSSGSQLIEKVKKQTVVFAYKIHANAVIIVPFKTGELRKSILVRFENENTTGVVYTYKPYSMTVEMRKPYLKPSYDMFASLYEAEIKKIVDEFNAKKVK